MENNYWKSIFGWFNFEKTYDAAVENAQDGDTIIELGTFLGKSTCYLAQRIKESGKKITFYACDIFLLPYESPSVPSEYWGDFYKFFIENLKKQDVIDLVIPVRANSLEFVSQIENNTASFIYIDDLHTVDHVYKEMVAWYPKLRKNGVMAGHDYFAIGPAVDMFVKEKGLAIDYIIDNSIWQLKQKE